ncbi:MAG: TIM barrel protein [Chloroflexota bacterium]|nr:TIM barrel protein [Chloroflexota bacterium]
MTKRTIFIDIGINGAFLTRRWEEPENWMRLTRELGYPHHEFCADVLDPFFSGDTSYQLEAAERTREAAKEYGVTITDVYTGMATHRFHGLSHSHPSVRARMREWIIRCMDIALAMGVNRIGGHWDAIPVEVLEDPARAESAMARTASQFRDLAQVATDKGMAALYNEQMYIPSETPWTIEQSYQFLAAVNRERVGVPVYLTVDVGHQAGMHYGLEGEDLSYEEWLRCFAPVSEVIHLQQTTADASAHWPFTPEYNAQGHVDGEAVLDAVKEGHRRFDSSPLAEYMAPVERNLLIVEAIPGSTYTEEQLLEDLTETARYLRQFVPEGGLSLSV